MLKTNQFTQRGKNRNGIINETLKTMNQPEMFEKKNNI